MILLLAAAFERPARSAPRPSHAPPPSGSPPSLLDLRFTGNDAVSAGDLERAVGLRPGVPLTDSVLRASVSAVVEAYRGRAFFAAAADAALSYRPGSDSLAADLVIAVREGLPAVVGATTIEASMSAGTSVPAEPLPGLEPGDPLDRAGVEEAIASLLSLYEREGHPFARAWLERVDRDSAGALQVVLGIDDGGPVRIEEIRVEGNTETRTAVLLRESRMDLPKRFDPAAIDAFAGRLRRLGLFASVGDPLVYPRDGGYGLLVRVSEGLHNTFDGVVGYAPPGPSQVSGAVTGSVTVALRNLFGTARRFDAGWSRDGSRTQEIRLRYEEPWVAGFPVNAGGGFSQRQQDSSFVDRRVSLTVEFMASAAFSVAAVGEHKRVIPSFGAGIPGSSTVTGGLAVRYDTRDDRQLPRSGVIYASEFRTGTRRPAGGSTGDPAAVRHLGLDLEGFLPVGRAHVIHLGAHGRQISTAGPQPGDLYRLGGFRTMRGFREDRFSGTGIAWGTAEYRLLAGGKSYVFGFVDPGYAVDGPGNAAATFTYGYGIGMRLETGLGLVGVSFALGEGDPLSETKLHFGLLNDF